MMQNISGRCLITSEIVCVCVCVCVLVYNAFFKCGSGRKEKSWKREAGIWDSGKTMRQLWFLILRRLIWASVYTIFWS